MPKSVLYKANSIVYFKGDTNESVYILKTGKVSLRYNDIETGQEVHEMIKTGEFFGVKSALGKYPKEETAVVLSDSTMVVFSVPEFESVAMQNTRIIMKMLKVFSNQLRRIHKQVRNLLSTGEQAGGPETGLFRIGEYYLKARRFPQALYAFRRYLTFYPSGQYANAATENIDLAERNLQGNGKPAPRMTGTGSGGQELSDYAKSYYNAVSLFSQQKYDEALGEFKQIIESGSDAEYEAKSQYEIGRCLYSLEDFDRCVTHFTKMIQKYPKHPDLVDALYYVGNCYEKKGDTGRAKSFYSKIISMASEDMPVYRRTKKSLRALEG
jgi:TolA-binding protein